MSRRSNGTNRAGKLVGASRYTGYSKPIKKAVSLAGLNDHIHKNLHPYYTGKMGGMQDEAKKNS